MSDISGISDLSFDDSINDPDYGNPNSSIEVSDFENISEYETLCSSIQNTKKPNNTTFNVEYDDEVRVIEASDEEDDVQVIKGKKKTKNPENWKRNKCKNAKASGEEHISLRGKLVLSRKIRPDCKCKNKCFIKVSDVEKNIIINMFNTIANKEKQDTYIAGLIKLNSVARRRPSITDNSKPKSCSCIYFIRIKEVEKRVCKKAFCSFLGIGKNRVQRIIKSLQKNEPSPLDKRGKHVNRGNKINEQIVFQIQTHIESFPARESHYSRIKNDSMRYLSPDLNMMKMYELYLIKYENEKWNQMQENNNIKPIVSYDFYRKYFSTNYKLSFGYPRVDTCQTCDRLQNLIAAEKDNELKKKLETEKQLHVSKAEVFYVDLRQKSEEAKLENSEIDVVSFDFQQNMPLPHIPCGDVFYKRQLWVYNFCIHSGRSGKSYFFMYDEATAHKGQNEVISFLNHYFSNIMDRSVKTVYLFSDNCSAQNKNFALTQFLYTITTNKIYGITKIIHRYPEPGHSFLPCDRAFGIIEKRRRKLERVYLPSTYKNLVQDTCKKFKVIDVEQNMILNYSQHTKALFKKTVNNRSKISFSILTYRFIEYTQHGLYSSVSVHSTAKDHFILQKPKTTLSLPTNDSLLYNGPLNIKEAKLKDVRDLASKYVPSEYLWYYSNLRSGEDEHTEALIDEDCNED